MSTAAHQTIPVQVWVDVDIKIAPLVRRLNRRSGIRTYASCQGGVQYGPYVMVGWLTRQAFRHLNRQYCLTHIENHRQPSLYTDGVAYLWPERRSWSAA